MKAKLLVLLFSVLSLCIVFNRNQQQHNLYTSDACGYYIYLPAIFIYHDLKNLSFYARVDSEYYRSLELQYSLYSINGHILNKYSCGVAIFEFPFFFVANVFCHLDNHYKPDGFSLPYQMAGIISNIFIAIAGLCILINFLRRYFDDTIVAFTILFVAFGTNLYTYTAFEFGMSHVYSFFLFCCLLSVTDLLYKQTKKGHILLLGIILGLIFLVRPINIVSVIIPVFWQIDTFSLFKDRIAFLKKILYILLSFSLFILIVLIQCAYWKYITNEWIYYSYKDEGFNFAHPNIYRGLFSYRKGWFIYTPMAFVGILGYYYLWKKLTKMAMPFLLFFSIFIYAIFCWREWWYGGSFGCRVLIETYAFLSLPLAATTEYFYNKKIMRSIFLAIAFFIVSLNIFQTYQYSMGLIHWSRMTGQYYWKVFGKVDFDRKENEKYLIQPDVENTIN